MSQEQQEQILNVLKQLSGEDAWKVYRGGILFLLAMKEKNEVVAEQIVNILGKVEAMDVKLMYRKGSRDPVVKVENISVDKLLVARLPLVKQKNEYNEDEDVKLSSDAPSCH